MHILTEDEVRAKKTTAQLEYLRSNTVLKQLAIAQARGHHIVINKTSAVGPTTGLNSNIICAVPKDFDISGEEWKILLAAKDGCGTMLSFEEVRHFLGR